MKPKSRKHKTARPPVGTLILGFLGLAELVSGCGGWI